MVTYSATTEDIVVRVSPVYIDGQSNIIDKRFVFGYFVRIENAGSDTVQLLRRQWLIIDGNGKIEEVDGEGVVGKQPVILSGHAHEYNSYCVLNTFEGSMEGVYLMERANGKRVRVEIPRFLLKAAVN
ncbi:Co2+/Mg2+ efflux protein ApaG [Bacteroidota bacterium]